MDLAVYISELLNEHGIVNVPGLGVFKQIRVAGYYNETEGKFYPPYYQASLTIEPVEDDGVLPKYISSKTKVSPGSARYFLNKYIADLLENVQVQQVALLPLGWLYKQDNEIKFKPSTTSLTPVAYGFTPIDLRKEAEPAVSPVVVRPVAEPVETPVQPVEPVQWVEAPIEQAIQMAAVPPAIPVEPAAVSIQEPEQPIAPPDTPAPVNVEALRKEPEVSQPVPVMAAAEAPPRPVESVATHHEHRHTPALENYSKTDTHSPQEVVHPKEADKSSWGASRLIIIAIMLVILAGGGFAIYKSLTLPKQDETGTEPAKSHTTQSPASDTVVINNNNTLPVTPDTLDSTTTTASRTDSVKTAATSQPVPTKPALEKKGTALAATPSASTPAAALSNDRNFKFTLLGGAFDSFEDANKAIKNYATLGIPAAIYENIPGRKVKVTLGYYATYAEGQQAKMRIVETKNLQSWRLYVEPIREKQK